jgi:hypothetical protein
MWTLLYPDFKKIKLFKEILQIETPNHAWYKGVIIGFLF